MANPEIDNYCPDTELQKLRARIIELESFISDSLPFLEEAWEACFHGQTERLLSAEERGMGQILQSFRAIAAKKPARAPNWLTYDESEKRVRDAIDWARRLLGDPNEPHPAIKRWCTFGMTTADGLKAAHARVVELEAQLELKSSTDFTDGLAALKAAWQKERAASQLTLGELIKILESLPPGTHVPALTGPHSYRGHYDDLAFRPITGRQLASDVLDVCRSCVGQEFRGYKGGDFVVGENTPVWIAEYGDCGKKIVGYSPAGITTAEDD